MSEDYMAPSNRGGIFLGLLVAGISGFFIYRYYFHKRENEKDRAATTVIPPQEKKDVDTRVKTTVVPSDATSDDKVAVDSVLNAPAGYYNPFGQYISSDPKDHVVGRKYFRDGTSVEIKNRKPTKTVVVGGRKYFRDGTSVELGPEDLVVEKVKHLNVHRRRNYG